jgi:hypothetical protein
MSISDNLFLAILMMDYRPRGRGDASRALLFMQKISAS